ncbi:MAG TPA: hypothetical protein VL992_00900 [Tepidisphaeraceae bacterium]|nr:hypothetical protein [Tepidisphaeraceae bacterium]
MCIPRRFGGRLASSVLLVLLGISPVYAQSRALSDVLSRKLAAFKRQIIARPNDTRTRDLSSGALLSLLCGDEPSVAEHLLRLAYATQDMNPDSRTYGQLQWIVSDAGITDLNAIDFNTLGLGPILLRYGDRLSPEFKADFAPHLSAALAGLHNHLVNVSYTNIWLMNCVCQMLLGQAAHDDRAVAEAEHRLDQWIAYTRENGIHEFNSPTYYGVDINELTVGYRYAASPADRQKFKTILDYFWTNIAANFFPAAGRLTGPYSRDYDFLSATGDLDGWFAGFGWIPMDQSNSFGLDGVFVLDDLRDGGYRPPQNIVDLANSGPRQIAAVYDDDPNHGIWNWIGPAVAIGSTTGNYCEQDKLFSATFAGPRSTPQISLVVDGKDDPYGLYRVRDKTNHPKAVHLASNLACVQDGSTVLLTSNIDPTRRPDYATSLSTNFLLPADATIAVDGKPMGSDAYPLNADSVITVAYGGATVSIRLLAAEPVDGVAPTWSFVADKEGLAHHAVRLRLMQLPEGRRADQAHVRCAFLVSADPIGAVQIDDQLDGDHWRMKVTMQDRTLEVDRSATRPGKIFAERVNGVQPTRSILSVNGKDIAAPVWDELN